MDFAGDAAIRSTGRQAVKRRAARAAGGASRAASRAGSGAVRMASASGAGAVRAAKATGSGAAAAAVRVAAVRKWRPSRSTLALIALGAVLLTAVAWLLVRNSSLVAVERVRVVGLDGYYDKNARRAVIAEAKTMTTMNASEDDLAAAVGEYLDVAGLRVDADLPHELTIFVDVRRPVAAVKAGGRVVAVTGDGLVLESSRGISSLPRVDAGGLIKGDRIADVKTARALTVLGAAPDVLLRRVKNVEWEKRGLVLTLDKGVKLRFGNAKDAAAKWRAAAAVLASPAAKGATYIDLRVPERPAIGGLGAAPVTQKPALEESLQNDPAADGGSTLPNGAGAPAGQAPAAQQPAGQAPAAPSPTTGRQPAAAPVAPPAAQGGAGIP